MQYIIGINNISDSRGTLYQLRFDNVYLRIAEGYVDDLRKLADKLNQT